MNNFFRVGIMPPMRAIIFNRYFSFTASRTSSTICPLLSSTVSIIFTFAECFQPLVRIRIQGDGPQQTDLMPFILAISMAFWQIHSAHTTNKYSASPVLSLHTALHFPDLFLNFSSSLRLCSSILSGWMKREDIISFSWCGFCPWPIFNPLVLYTVLNCTFSIILPQWRHRKHQQRVCIYPPNQILKNKIPAYFLLKLVQYDHFVIAMTAAFTGLENNLPGWLNGSNPARHGLRLHH